MTGDSFQPSGNLGHPPNPLLSPFRSSTPECEAQDGGLSTKSLQQRPKSGTRPSRPLRSHGACHSAKRTTARGPKVGGISLHSWGRFEARAWPVTLVGEGTCLKIRPEFLQPTAHTSAGFARNCLETEPASWHGDVKHKRQRKSGHLSQPNTATRSHKTQPEAARGHAEMELEFMQRPGQRSSEHGLLLRGRPH